MKRRTYVLSEIELEDFSLLFGVARHYRFWFIAIRILHLVVSTIRHHHRVATRFLIVDGLISTVIVQRFYRKLLDVGFLSCCEDS